MDGAQVPMEYGKDLLRTPDFLINLMGFAGTPGDTDYVYNRLIHKIVERVEPGNSLPSSTALSGRA
jgi:hypothetical protein